MVRTEQKKHRYGLVGRDIEYSFSRSYFSKKFEALGMHNCTYENFDLQSIEEFPALIAEEKLLRGLNVTIPYKEVVIPYLDQLDPEAREIGAVNTIEFTEEGLVGHNTDVYGFREALMPILNMDDKFALILGTGGASKAVAHVFNKLSISYKYVSRKPKSGQWEYGELDPAIMSQYSLIVNSTPVGTFPNTDQKPAIPYEELGPKHLLFDLVYNPEITSFMKAGMKKGARVLNGYRMLELQAEKAWSIWNS